MRREHDTSRGVFGVVDGPCTTAEGRRGGAFRASGRQALSGTKQAAAQPVAGKQKRARHTHLVPQREQATRPSQRENVPEGEAERPTQESTNKEAKHSGECQRGILI